MVTACLNKFTGEIQKEWSSANICPLFKKGDRSLACNKSRRIGQSQHLQIIGIGKAQYLFPHTDSRPETIVL